MTVEKKTQEVSENDLGSIQAGTCKNSTLVAHELTHVIQGRDSGVASTAGGTPDGIASTAGGSPDGFKKIINGEMGKGEI